MRFLLMAAALLTFQAQADKLPVPSQAEQEESQKRIRELFKDEYAKRSPGDVLALAQKLLKQAAENKSESTLVFTLLREARDKAIEGGDPTLALTAIDESAKTFLIAFLDEKTEALDRIKKKAVTSESSEILLASYLSVITHAIRVDAYDPALKLFSGAEEVAQRFDASRLTEVKNRKREVESIAKEYKALKKSLALLQETPEDPVANLAVGKFRCFAKGDYEGLTLLTKSSDTALKALAEKELLKPEDDVSAVDLGDRWYELAKKVDAGKWEKRFYERAFLWYDRAWPKKTGLARVELDKKLNDREEKFGKVNLLRIVDPEKDARPPKEFPKAKCAWVFNGTVLVAPVMAGTAALEIPYSPPADYDLEITLEYLGNRGSDLFFIFLPSPGGWGVAFEGEVKNGHRLSNSANALSLPTEKGKLIDKTPIFANGKPASLLFSVRGGNLTLTCDNKILLFCPGKFSRPAEGKGVLSLNCYSAAYQVHSCKISPPGKRLR